MQSSSGLVVWLRGMLQATPKTQYAEMCLATGCHLNSQLMKDLPETVEGLGALKKLDFSRSMLGGGDVEPLVSTILRHCSNLQVLNLSHNYLTDSNVIRICETLVEHSRSLVSLDLSDNLLSNKVGKYLSRFHESMPALRCLKLQKTLMSERVARQLSNPCSRSVRPTGDSARGPSLATATVEPLEEHCVVRPCHRSDDAVGSEGVHRVANAEEQFPALHKLWRIAAVAAPTKDNYSRFATLMSLTREGVGPLDRHQAQ
ncbi:hypothetical protein ERJ75_000733000 [Trypanosoma vivax]|uniref:Leucine-rich repeat protein (LRRP) n=1 Tax=Trypanosoma vivax (strain Y486) TaxID=1055687 RepID=G0TX91_TRYVY|nr:hypothetical protein TRVL_07340 [Trypanosoma vivax]KAH8614123.1 hypothetical protein ERJ75_000733000 [Trypanosoma vivax]CCC48581.1 conserved hypothetical protein [Trypanosoma vivax Y486]